MDENGGRFRISVGDYKYMAQKTLVFVTNRVGGEASCHRDKIKAFFITINYNVF